MKVLRPAWRIVGQGKSSGGFERMENQESNSKERLERVFRILEVIHQRRLESSEEWVGVGLEWQLLERELRELEEDLGRDPPVLPGRAGQSHPPRGN
jgi:hypothetical protein